MFGHSAVLVDLFFCRIVAIFPLSMVSGLLVEVMDIVSCATSRLSNTFFMFMKPIDFCSLSYVKVTISGVELFILSSGNIIGCFVWAGKVVGSGFFRAWEVLEVVDGVGFAVDALIYVDIITNPSFTCVSGLGR